MLDKPINLLPKSYKNKRSFKRWVYLLLSAQLCIVILYSLSLEMQARVINTREGELLYMQGVVYAQDMGASYVASSLAYVQGLLAQDIAHGGFVPQGTGGQLRLGEVLGQLPAGVVGVEVSYFDGYITLSVVSEDVNEIPLLTDRLRAVGFTSVYILNAQTVDDGIHFLINIR